MGKDTVPTMEIEHVEIHEGEHFFVSDIDTDIDTTKYWRITAADHPDVPHFIFTVSLKNAGLVQFYENPAIDAAGTALPSFNNHRNVADTAGATAFKDTTTTSDGTLLLSIRLAAGDLGKSGGIIERNNEIILKQNEDYIIKVTTDAINNEGTLLMEWYERAKTRVY